MPPSEVPHATALSRFAAIAIPLGFCVHSSSLGLVNKHALSLIAEPMLMTLAQVTCAVVVCLLLRCCGAIRFGAIRASRSRHSCLQFAARWISISIFFVGSLWTSQGLIMRTNVECVIAARAFSGLLVAALEPLLLRSPRPSFSAVLCLACVGISAALFARSVEIPNMRSDSVIWALGYITFVTCESMAGKAMVDGESELTAWGLVLCSNGFALLVVPVYVVVTGRLLPLSGETRKHYADHWVAILAPLTSPGIGSGHAAFWWSISIMLATGISFFAMATRRLVRVKRGRGKGRGRGRGRRRGRRPGRVLYLPFTPPLPLSPRLPSIQLSATQFTVLGIANKFATLLFAYCMMKQHVSRQGLAFLIACITASVGYGHLSSRSQRAQLAIASRQMAIKRARVNSGVEDPDDEDNDRNTSVRRSSLLYPLPFLASLETGGSAESDSGQRKISQDAGEDESAVKLVVQATRRVVARPVLALPNIAPEERGLLDETLDDELSSVATPRTPRTPREELEQKLEVINAQLAAMKKKLHGT